MLKNSKGRRNSVVGHMERPGKELEYRKETEWYKMCPLTSTGCVLTSKSFIMTHVRYL